MERRTSFVEAAELNDALAENAKLRAALARIANGHHAEEAKIVARRALEDK